MPHRSKPLSTSISSLDEELRGGIQPGTLNVIAGPPMSRKSSLMRKILIPALKEGRKCLYFTEDRAERVAEHFYRAGWDLRPSLRNLFLVKSPAQTQDFLNLMERPDIPFDAIFVDNLTAPDPAPRMVPMWPEFVQKITKYSDLSSVPIVATVQTRRQLVSSNVLASKIYLLSIWPQALSWFCPRVATTAVNSECRS